MMHLYSALLCIAVTAKALYNPCRGGGGGGGGGVLSSTTTSVQHPLDEPIETCTLGDILLLETLLHFCLTGNFWSILNDSVRLKIWYMSHTSVCFVVSGA